MGPLPGFWPAMGLTLTFVTLLVLIPLSTVVFKTSSLGFEGFLHVISAPRALAAYRLTFVASFVAAALDTLFGLLVAWVLVRYRFPGHGLLDALVDLPFAVPTA